MASNVNIARFRYFPFLRKLVTTGEYSWQTPEIEGDEKLVTRFYIDGDILFWHPVDENDEPLDISPEVIAEHSRKINQDLASINILAGHIGLATAFLTAILTWVINHQYWLEQTAVITVLGIVGYIFKNITIKGIFKVVGAVAGIFLRKKK